MSSKVGRQVTKIKTSPASYCDATGYRYRSGAKVKDGEIGIVVYADTYDSYIRVVYPPDPDSMYPTDHRRIEHKLSNEFDTWQWRESPTYTMTIENERSYALYVASSSEDIKGYVPQVRYRDEIVWQGDPVPATDDSGEKISKEEQSKKAIETAEAKIDEVVKKQFA